MILLKYVLNYIVYTTLYKLSLQNLLAIYQLHWKLIIELYYKNHQTITIGR